MAKLASTAACIMLAAPAMAEVNEALAVARITASRSISRPLAACPGPHPSPVPGPLLPPPSPPGPPPPPPLLTPLPPPLPPVPLPSLVPDARGFLSGAVVDLLGTFLSRPSGASSESSSNVAVVVEMEAPLQTRSTGGSGVRSPATGVGYPRWVQLTHAAAESSTAAAAAAAASLTRRSVVGAGAAGAAAVAAAERGV